MAYPPPTLPTNRTNASPQQDIHPNDHNAIGGAINDISAHVQAIDSGAVKVGAAVNADYAASANIANAANSANYATSAGSANTANSAQTAVSANTAGTANDATLARKVRSVDTNNDIEFHWNGAGLYFRIDGGTFNLIQSSPVGFADAAQLPARPEDAS